MPSSTATATRVMRVRSAAPRDLESIVHFQQKMAEETEGRMLPADVVSRGVALALKDPAKARYLVAESEGRVVGTLMLTTEWSDWRAGWFWWIQSVFVAREHRGRGVYRMLYDEVLRRARIAPDVIGLRLYVEETNGDAQQVYARLGMERTGYRMFETLIERSSP